MSGAAHPTDQGSPARRSPRRSRRFATVALAAAAALVVPTAGAVAAGSAPRDASPGTPLDAAAAHRAGAVAGHAPHIPVSSHTAGSLRLGHSASAPAPAGHSGLPTSGPVTVMLELTHAPAVTTWAATRRLGRSAATLATRRSTRDIQRLQASVLARVHGLTAATHVLFSVHTAYDGIAVRTDAAHLPALLAIPGVKAVHRIVAKHLDNTSTVPLIGAPTAWSGVSGDTGAGERIGIIDTGIDYTHADFGGPGTASAYQNALAHDTEPIDPASIDSTKIAGGVDLVGDAYDASDPATATPVPDSNFLDCNSHGTHVAGTAAGYGVLANGSSAKGTDYSSLASLSPSQYRSTFRIGPGVAPGADLYAIKVFGCSGSTDVVSEALDWALDPNGDGNLSDHLDVVNMSLGSDYATDDDPDAVAANNAAEAGLIVAAAAGNGGDLFDVGGSPGNAREAIGVAASNDDATITDGLQENSPTSRVLHEESSEAFDWSTQPSGFTGDLYFISAANADGCSAYDTTDAAGAVGHIVVVQWPTGAFPCGSAARANNAADAGAAGLIIWYGGDLFDFGITGNNRIPEVLVPNADGQALADDAAANPPVNVTIGDQSLANSQSIVRPQDVDKVADFSSRGDRQASNVKPDLAAPGVTVFSAGMGTGNGGLTDSGTSMATPHVAGSAALVKAAHPGWTPEQVKADLMNTADHDVYTGDNQTGDSYAPNRVGAGRLDVAAAVGNDVVAYVHDGASDTGAVSASFGPLDLLSATTRTKTVQVVNTGATAASFAVAYHAIDDMPGVDYATSVSSLTVPAGQTASFRITMTVDPTALVKTMDSTIAAQQDGLSRQFVSDASGRVVLSPSGGYAGPALRVPVYAAPRPQSRMSTPAKATLPGTGVSTSTVSLKGTGVPDTGGFPSYVAGFELQGASPAMPACSPTVTTECVPFPSERAGDLRYVGVTSDAPAVASAGGNALTDGMTYFAIATAGPWRTPVSYAEYDVLFWNTTGDLRGVLFNTRLSGTDVFVSELIGCSGSGNSTTCDAANPIDLEFLNVYDGRSDTHAFDSDVLVMPVATGAIPGISGANSRISYTVEAYTAEGGFDEIGEDATSGPMSFDPLHPAYTVTDGTSGDLYYQDLPGNSLVLRQDAGRVGADSPLGVLFLHTSNQLATRAQVMRVMRASATVVSLSHHKAGYSAPIKATVTVKSSLPGVTPTGSVRLSIDGALFKTLTLHSGSASVALPWVHPGGHTVSGKYLGDATNNPSSGSAQLQIIRDYVMVRTHAVHRYPSYGTRDTIVATVSPMYSARATPKGWVAFYIGNVRYTTKRLVAGKASMTERWVRRGKHEITAIYLGNRDSRRAKGTNWFKVI